MGDCRPWHDVLVRVRVLAPLLPRALVVSFIYSLLRAPYVPTIHSMGKEAEGLSAGKVRTKAEATVGIWDSQALYEDAHISSLYLCCTRVNPQLQSRPTMPMPRDMVRAVCGVCCPCQSAAYRPSSVAYDIHWGFHTWGSCPAVSKPLAKSTCTK